MRERIPRAILKEQGNLDHLYFKGPMPSYLTSVEITQNIKESQEPKAPNKSGKEELHKRKLLTICL